MIRQVCRDEIPECVQVIRDSFMTVAEEFNLTFENAPRFTAFATNNERLYWQYDNEHRLMFAYYAEEKIIGYYSLNILENDQCELNNLCVLPAYRHNKIGETLLKSAFAQAKKLKCNKIKASQMV